MFGIGDDYYNQSLRKLVIGFGKLFNEIYVQRLSSTNQIIETIRVPLSYAPKEKFVNRLNSGVSSISDSTKIEIVLPAIGFQMSGLVYDPTRKLNKLKTTFYESSTELSSMWSEVPYNVSFTLFVFTRTMDDNLQIIEQILPNFTPDFTVTLNFNSLNNKVDVPIVLNSVQTAEDYEGTFQTRRSVTSTLTFTAKTYIYGKIKETPNYIIETADINFFDGLDKATDYKFDIGYTGDSIIGDIHYVP